LTDFNKNAKFVCMKIVVFIDIKIPLVFWDSYHHTEYCTPRWGGVGGDA